MPAPTPVESSFDVESFIKEYYDAWGGTDLDRIMSYYAEDVVLQTPAALMQGKGCRARAVRKALYHCVRRKPSLCEEDDSWTWGGDG
jgi:ketosteroid isomerase-like protein